MARIIYSGLVDSIRGSIAGTTFQSNAYGHTIKKKPNIVKPKSALQNNRKYILSQVTRTWRTMTQSQRDAWNTWASTYPQYAKHNSSAELSGYAVFVKFNCLRFLSGQAIRTTGLAAPAAPDDLTYTVDVTSSVLKIFIDSTTDDEAWYILFFASRQFTSSQKFIGSSPKFITSTSNTDKSIDITNEYTALFGDIPAAGDFVALDALLIGDNAPKVLARDSQIYEVQTGTS